MPDHNPTVPAKPVLDADAAALIGKTLSSVAAPLLQQLGRLKTGLDIAAIQMESLTADLESFLTPLDQEDQRAKSVRQINDQLKLVRDLFGGCSDLLAIVIEGPVGVGSEQFGAVLGGT